MIEGQTIVYFGPEQWQSMWRNRHQLLSRLARANTVVYVEPRPYVDEIVRGLRGNEIKAADLLRERQTSARMVQDKTGVWVYRSPRYAPLGGPPPLRAVTRLLRRRALQRDLRVLRPDRSSRPVRSTVLWISTPTQWDARLDLPGSLRVYHIVDDYLAYHDLPEAHRARFAQRERALIDWADLVITVSPELIATKGGLPREGGDSKFRLLPNGYAGEAYRAERPVRIPEALAGLRRPIIGYVGLISVRLDLLMLDALAAGHPEWTFALMGTVYRSGCEDALDRLSKRPNVCLLPAVGGEQVADYVRSFDVGLVPYRVTQETLHASPLKVYEYLAAGLPVVAADVPGARQFAPVLTIASSVEEWERGIAQALVSDNEGVRAARRAAVAGHSWDARVETLSGFLAEALSRREGQGCGSR